MVQQYTISKEDKGYQIKICIILDWILKNKT